MQRRWRILVWVCEAKPASQGQRGKQATGVFTSNHTSFLCVSLRETNSHKIEFAWRYAILLEHPVGRIFQVWVCVIQSEPDPPSCHRHIWIVSSAEWVEEVIQGGRGREGAWRDGEREEVRFEKHTHTRERASLLQAFKSKRIHWHPCVSVCELECKRMRERRL